MGGILVRRLAGALPILLIVSLITFAMIHLIPGDPAVAIAGMSATAEQVANIRRDLGLDQPLLAQLWDWYINLLHGDLGRSLLLGQPVVQVTMQRLPITLALSAYALVLTLMIGLLSGIVAALRQNTWIDQAAMVLAMLGISLPSFYLGLLMIILFAVDLRWLPTGGYIAFSDNPAGWLAPRRCLRYHWRCCLQGCWPGSPAPQCWRCSVRTTSAPLGRRACQSGRSC